VKILIVEDEPEAREGLQTVLAEANPDWLILPPCMDGDAGLAAARLHRPDVILTDIRMPRQDGLAMIEAYRAEAASAVVVISGFPDFDYARRCLSLGVREYLLKPVTAAQLVETVRTIEDEGTGTLELAGMVSAELPALPSPLGPGVLILCRHAKPLDGAGRRVLQREFRRLLEPRRLWFAAFETETWLFAEGSRTAALARPGFLTPLSDRLGQIVVASARDVFYAQVPDVANEVRQDCQDFLVCSGDRILVGPREPGFRPDYPLIHEARLSEALRNPARLSVSEALEGFFEDVFREGHDPHTVVRHTQRFFSAILNTLKDLGPGRFRLLLDLHPVEQFEKVFSRDEVRRHLRRYSEVLAMREAEDEPDSENPKIQAALAILHDRLTAPPSLGALAAELRLSPEYLSRLFKHEMGEGYARFVMNRRIRLATTLLADRDLSIGVVADRAGFQNQKYFFEVFRRATGQTPSEFRSRFL
jgi:two-component system response regulator YesN